MESWNPIAIIIECRNIRITCRQIRLWSFLFVLIIFRHHDLFFSRDSRQTSDDSASVLIFTVDISGIKRREYSNFISFSSSIDMADDTTSFTCDIYVSGVIHILDNRYIRALSVQVTYDATIVAVVGV